MFEEIQEKYREAFNSGDVDALLDNYAQHGLTVVEPGVALSRSDDLREAMVTYFAEAKPRTDYEFVHTYVAGDVALVVTEWSLEEQGPDGGRETQRGRATDVLVREQDGKWRFAVRGVLSG